MQKFDFNCIFAKIDAIFRQNLQKNAMIELQFC